MIVVSRRVHRIGMSAAEVQDSGLPRPDEVAVAASVAPSIQPTQAELAANRATHPSRTGEVVE
jgi:hypothetical protein